VKVIFIGDIVGKPGRKAIRLALPDIYAKYKPDIVIANIENAAGGLGVTYEKYEELNDTAIDFFTSGNHIWHHKEVEKWLDDVDNLIRPANYKDAPGRGWAIFKNTAIINLEGRVFMSCLENPFTTADAILKQIPDEIKVRIVDMHAEATSEKAALAWYLDGRVSAVIGTHTHVQTGDARIFPQGTAFLTDAGMTGPMNSVIGMDVASVTRRFITQRPTRFSVPSGAKILSYVYLEIDDRTGHALKIENKIIKI